MREIKSSLFIGIILGVIYLFSGCDEIVNGDNVNVTIVETDSLGNILRDDQNQWQPRQPPGPFILHFGPAYPSPTRKDTMNLPFTMPVQDTAIIVIYGLTGRNVVDSVQNSILPAGKYIINYSNKAKGIFKAVMYVPHLNFSSYGYIKFE